MMSLTSSAVADVQARNEAFALQHDIDDYYTKSSPLIRWVEGCRLRAVRRMTAATVGHKILEIGCGGGHVLQLFPNAKLTGVDVSARMLDKARKNLQGYNVKLLRGELHELSLPSAGYDRVICTEVLEHTEEPKAILAQIRGLLRPDGHAIITFPNDHVIRALKSWLRRTGLERLPVFGRLAWGGDEYHLHVWRVAEMRALLRSYFVIEQERLIPARVLPIRCCFRCRIAL